MKTTYEVVVQHRDGHFYTAELDGREGVPVYDFRRADAFAKQLLGDEVRRVLVVERRVVKEYNGHGG